MISSVHTLNKFFLLYFIIKNFHSFVNKIFFTIYLNNIFLKNVKKNFYYGRVLGCFCGFFLDGPDRVLGSKNRAGSGAVF